MAHVLYVIGWNLSIAALAATVVWLLCRTRMLRQRPGLCHGLWLLVLVKLVAPPLVSVSVLPAMSPDEHRQIATFPNSAKAVDAKMDSFSSPGHGANEIEGVAAAIDQGSTEIATAGGSTSRVDSSWGSHRVTWREISVGLLGVSLFGTLVLWLAALRQLQQVSRLLRGCAVPSGREVDLLRDVSLRFKRHPATTLQIVDASITPMLWAQPGNPTIILPRQLADSLDDDQLRTIIAHEIGHFVRCDHWSNSFAFMVTTLFWWNPVAWFARRELIASAEACCDALAVEQLAGSRKSYAETLLAVVDYVTSARLVRPALCVTFGESRSLRRRFEVLANLNVKSNVSRAGWLLLTLGGAASVLLPARAQESTALTAVTPAATTVDEPDAAALQADGDPQDSEQDLKQYITGIVSERATHKPIADAKVNILVDSEQESDKRGLIATTDADGRYRIEVPLGSVRLWFPRLKPGYWLEHEDNVKTLVTSPDMPIVTHHIAAISGIAWPVRVTVEGGIPAGEELMVSVTEIADDATRQSRLKGDGVSFKISPNSSMSTLGVNGIGAFTQCGESGKLVVSLGGHSTESVMTEFIVTPGFEISKVKSIARVAGTDKVTMIDAAGATATIGKAEITLEGGLPLLTFHLARKPPSDFQAFAGRLVDRDGNPVEAVRVGVALAVPSGGSSDTGDFAITDKDGRFSLNLAMPESREKHHLMLIITKDGYASVDSSDIALPREAPHVVDVGKFVLQTGRSLPVRAVDANDKPLAGAVVEPQHDYAQRRQAIRTDAQGRGILRNLPAGVTSVYASYGSLMLQSKVVVHDQAAENEECTLRLRPFEAARVRPLPVPPPLGAAAPKWSIVGWTDGRTRTLDDYRGKVIVLEFWDASCSACMNGLPATKEIEARYAGRGDVVFLGIHSGGTTLSQIQKLQQLKDWKLVTGLDQGSSFAEGATARAYGARGWPTTVIIDREGKFSYNSGLETCAMVDEEMARIATALKLPAEDPEASTEVTLARTNQSNVFRMSELIDRALGQK